MQHMETEELNVVTAAVLADAAFEAEAKFSSKRYRETIEKMRRTGEFPQTWRPASVDPSQLRRQGA